jgi:hypothetical protein
MTKDLKEYSKEYYQQNREKVLAYYRQKIKCEDCGKEMSRRNKTDHKGTAICLKRQEMLKKSAENGTQLLDVLKQISSSSEENAELLKNLKNLLALV